MIHKPILWFSQAWGFFSSEMIENALVASTNLCGFAKKLLEVFRAGDAHMHMWTGYPLIQVMVCRL